MFARLYSRLSSSHNEVLWILLSILVIVLFIFLNPRVQQRWQSWPAERLQSDWQRTITETKTIDAAQWWEFRAKYAPGEFTYNENLLAVFSILQLKTENLSLLTYNSLFTYNAWQGHLKSNEALAVSAEQRRLRQEFMYRYPRANWIIDQPDTLYGIEGERYVMWIVRPLAEMKQVNGLINYEDPAKVLEKNQWVWITEATWGQPGVPVSFETNLD